MSTYNEPVSVEIQPPESFHSATFLNSSFFSMLFAEATAAQAHQLIAGEMQLIPDSLW